MSLVINDVLREYSPDPAWWVLERSFSMVSSSLRIFPGFIQKLLLSHSVLPATGDGDVAFALSFRSRELKEGPRGRRHLTLWGQMSGWRGALAAETGQSR